MTAKRRSIDLHGRFFHWNSYASSSLLELNTWLRVATSLDFEVCIGLSKVGFAADPLRLGLAHTEQQTCNSHLVSLLHMFATYGVYGIVRYQGVLNHLGVVSSMRCSLVRGVPHAVLEWFVS